MQQPLCVCHALVLLVWYVSIARQPEVVIGVRHIADGGSRAHCQAGAQVTQAGSHLGCGHQALLPQVRLLLTGPLHGQRSQMTPLCKSCMACWSLASSFLYQHDFVLRAECPCDLITMVCCYLPEDLGVSTRRPSLWYNWCLWQSHSLRQSCYGKGGRGDRSRQSASAFA